MSYYYELFDYKNSNADLHYVWNYCWLKNYMKIYMKVWFVLYLLDASRFFCGFQSYSERLKGTTKIQPWSSIVSVADSERFLVKAKLSHALRLFYKIFYRASVHVPPHPQQ